MKIKFEKLLKDAKELANLIKESKDNYKAVFGIPAGGLIPGYIVADKLNLPLLSLEDYRNYKNKEEVLVVDDLVDSGKTIEKYSGSNTAVIYKKERYKKPITYVLYNVNNDWISLPHEKDETGIGEHIERIQEFSKSEYKKLIGIKTKTVFFHRWLEAPLEVDFLSNYHRHEFNIEIQYEVNELNREKEFFIEKEKIDEYLKNNIEGRYLEISCETLASELLKEFNAYQVKVQEDDQNFSIIKKLI